MSESSNAGLVALGELSASVAHELRNALQVIATNVYLASHEPSELSRCLERIARSTRHAQHIVDDVLALATGLALATEPVLLVDVLRSAREELSNPSATFDDTGVAPALTLHAHGRLLSRVLHALYDNAVRASAPRVPVIVTRAKVDADGATVIEVTDDGPGVPVELKSVLFEPLVTAHPTGTGLGLALARRIVQAHNGTVELVDSTCGASFRITLPGRVSHGECP
jgi:signal transduction histidine kinase